MDTFNKQKEKQTKNAVLADGAYLQNQKTASEETASWFLRKTRGDRLPLVMSSIANGMRLSKEKAALASDPSCVPRTYESDTSGTWYDKSIATRTLVSSENVKHVDNDVTKPAAGIGPAVHGIPSPGRYQTTGLAQVYHELWMKKHMYKVCIIAL